MSGFTAGVLLVIRENYTKHSDLIKSVRKIKESGGTLIGFLKSGCISEHKPTTDNTEEIRGNTK